MTKRTRKRLPLCILAGSLIALSSFRSASADTWRGRELEQQWRSAAWSVGPFRLQPSIVLANAGVDSNVYYTPSNPVKDFTLTIGPAVDAYLPIFRKLILSAYGSPQYVYYLDTARERTWNYYFNSSAALNLRRVFLSFDYRYSDARERWSTEIDVRPRRKENGLGGSFLVQTSHRTSLAVGYRESKYDYESIYVEEFNVQQRLNRKEQYLTFSAYYQATSRTRLFADLEYGQFRFDFAVSAALKDSKSQAAYGGLEFSPTGRIRGRVRLGYKYFNVENPELKDYHGLVGDSQVSVRVARPLVVRASYTRDVVFSLWYTNAYYIGSIPGVGASVYLLKSLRLDYDYSFGRNEYPQEQPVIGGGGTIKRLDEFQTHSVGLYFRIWKKAALGVIGSRWERTSNLAYENDTRYFLGLNLTYDF